jgi:hypothetical protein
VSRQLRDQVASVGAKAPIPLLLAYEAASAISPVVNLTHGLVTHANTKAAGFGVGCHLTNSARGETICQKAA